MRILHHHWTKRNQYKILEYRKKFKEHRKKYNGYYKEQNLNKLITHNIVLKAIKEGILSKPKDLICVCGKNATLYHHEDYSKPLIVIPLCNKCHSGIHNGLINIKQKVI